MSRVILQTRLTELERSLSRVCLPAPHPGETDERLIVRLDDLWNVVLPRIWDGLEGEIEVKAKNLLADIRELKELNVEADREGELAEDWQRFMEIEVRATDLFREFTELIGGLAFRDRNRDPWFFRTADHLVRKCSEYTPDHRHSLVLTVPWVHDTIAQTLAQIVRLRFPDWTVWALPLGAFEFARIYLALDRENPSNIRQFVSTRLELDADRLRAQLELVADVFAAFTQGPAYAFAALHLRIPPASWQRGHAIFTTLDAMEVRQWSEDLDRELDQLRSEWRACPGREGLPGPAEREEVEKVVEVALGAFDRYLRRTAPFESRDWRAAESLRKLWGDRLREHPDQPPDLEEDQGIELRAVLNAAWQARVEPPRDAVRNPVDAFAGATRTECLRILDREARSMDRSDLVGTSSNAPTPSGRARR